MEDEADVVFCESGHFMWGGFTHEAVIGEEVIEVPNGIYLLSFEYKVS